MFNPFHFFSPVDDASRGERVLAVLALWVLPALFVLVSAAMAFVRVSRPPYFAYLCAFGALGTMCLGLVSLGSPMSVPAFLFALLILPLLMVRNLSVLRSRPERSVFHVGARSASLFSLAVILLFLLWTLWTWRAH